MKNYKNNDYAINKKAKGIVYRFADKTVEITLEDYLRENPGKTEADFAVLKALSDSDYHDRDRDNYRKTWKDVPFNGLGKNDACAVPSPEDEVIEQPEQSESKKKRQEMIKQALETLTLIQRRRYILYHVKGYTVRKIADIEKVHFTTVYEALQAAEKKIKKIF